MATALSINKHIYTILSSDEKLREMVGKNIYPVIAEENVTYPFVIFKRQAITPTYAKNALQYDTCSFSVAIVTNTYIQTIEIAERVRTILECYSGDAMKQVRLQAINEEYMDDAYVQELNFDCVVFPQSQN